MILHRVLDIRKGHFHPPEVNLRHHSAPRPGNGKDNARRDPGNRQPPGLNRQRHAGCFPSHHLHRLSEMPFVFAYGRRQAPERPVKRSDPVTLIAKAGLDGDRRTRQVRFTQQFGGMLDAESRGGIRESFPRDASVGRSQPGGMQTDRGGESVDFSGRVVLEQPGHVVKPASVSDGRLHARRLQEPHRPIGRPDLPADRRTEARQDRTRSRFVRIRPDPRCCNGPRRWHRGPPKDLR